jgi:signal transduction histidine kinase
MRECVTNANGLEHTPDDTRNPPPGFVVDSKGERGARAAKAASRRDIDADEERLAFLTDASRRLAASLDYESSLTTVAGLSLPLMNAWVIVDVLDDDGGVRRLTVQHPDPDKDDAARALRDRYHPLPGDLPDIERVIREGHHEVGSDVSPEVLAARARDAEHLALLETLSVQAYMSVPMSAHGSIWGAITYIAHQEGRRFSDLDREVAEDFARRAAMAIESARLHLAADSSRAETEAAIAAAEEAGRRKSEFLATMSHEFRTPLNAILGYAQLLDMGVLGPTTAAQTAHLERLQASAQHLLQLVDDVLDVAKADADRLEVRQDILMTGAAVVSASALVHPQATAKGIRLFDLNANVPGSAYVGDERRVRQILVNLLSNAVKFTPPGGEVTVICGATNEPDPGTQLGEGASPPTSAEVPHPGLPWAFIRVSDSGAGIAPQFMSRLFEPFVQADGALTREKGGTGLGLAISRRLARRMGGDITVRSKPGAGAIFTLWLPAPRAEAAAKEAPARNGSLLRRTPSSSDIIEKVDAANLDANAYAVLHAIGTRLSTDAETIAERYVAAIREDGSFPGARELRGVQLRDHATPFVGLLASQLAIIGETRGEEPELLGDGGHVQRLMAELHGAQRHRLGWSESDIEREIHILFGEVERAIRLAVDAASTVDAMQDTAAGSARLAISPASVSAALKYALDVASRVLHQASTTTVRTFRFAKNADAP